MPCLLGLKMASIEVKQISSSFKTRMRITFSVYEKYAIQCLCICTYRAQRFACMFDTETGCVCVSYKPLNASNNQLTIVHDFRTRKHAASVGLRHARMIVSAGLSDSYATLLFPFSRTCFRVVKAVGILIPDPATGRGQRYDRTHPYSGTHAC